MLSRFHANQLGRCGTFVTRLVHARLLAFLREAVGCEEKLQSLFVAMSASHAILSGSIILQVLLGKDIFPANDCDFFLPMYKREDPELYTPLHRFLYQLSTSRPSIRGKPWTIADHNEELKTISFPTVDDNIHPVSHKIRVSTYRDINQVNTIHDPRISIVIDYKMPSGIKIQVVSLASRTVDDTALANAFIDKSFDFTCTMAKFCIATRESDESKLTHLTLPPFSDIYQRRLVLRKEFERRMMFASPESIAHHRATRVQKYMERGFVFFGYATTGLYYDALKQIPLPYQQERSVEEWINICEDSGKRKAVVEDSYECSSQDDARRCRACKRKCTDTTNGEPSPEPT